jgi:adenylate cyclase
MEHRLFVSIGFKLIAIISLIIIAALGGMTFFATQFFTGDVETTVKFNTLERAEMIASKLQTDLLSLMEKGRLISAALEGGLVAEGTKEDVSSIFFHDGEGLLSVVLVSEAGKGLKIVKSAVDAPEVLKYQEQVLDPVAKVQADATEYSRAFLHEIVVSNVSSRFGYPVLGISFPYSDRPGQGQRIIVLFVAANRFLDILQSRGMYVDYVVNARGDLIVHPDISMVLARSNAARVPIVRDFLTSPATLKQLRYAEAGVGFLGSYKKMDLAGLGTVSTVRESLALEGVLAIQWRNLLITILIVAGAVTLVYFFSKTLTNPVKRLVEATVEIQEGNFQVTLTNRGRDEIGRLTSAFTEMAHGLAEREKIKDAFGKFVNKEIAERVLRDEIKLGGERKEATIFFSDIRSFTAISEKLEPEEVVEFLNEYMTRMIECVNQTHGVVDKFIGDAIMAVWGAPVSRGNDTENAVNGALMMRKSLLEFNLGRGDSHRPLIKIGAGINSGPVLAGQIGSLDRMEYTVIGDAVNLASRIEALNKPFGTDILISENAYEAVKEIFRVQPMKKITVKGKTEAQQIYAVIGRFDEPSDPQSLTEVRALLGIEDKKLEELNADEKEEKFTILE